MTTYSDESRLTWHSTVPRSATPQVHKVVWWRSIRLRLAVTLAVVATLLVGVFGLLAARAVLGAARDQQRETAIADLQAATATYTFSGQVNADVSVGATGIPITLTRILAPGVLATWDDGTQLWTVRQLADGTVLTTRSSDAPILERWHNLRDEILELAGIVAAVAVLSGWALASGFTRRIRLTAVTARTISEGELSERALDSGSDEITVLARAVNTMADELVDRIEHERTLTADAAHELRTPLTALVSATELLGNDPDAYRVRQHTTRLRHVLEDVLRLARLESEPNHQQLAAVDLGTFTAEVLADSSNNSHCQLTIHEPTRVRVDIEGARRAIENLLANCARHGESPIDVTVTGTVLAIEDSGPGYPAELLSKGPRRFHPIGPTGRTGLGLTIAARELVTMGARLTLTNTERGAKTAVTFQPASTPTSITTPDAPTQVAGSATTAGPIDRRQLDL